MFLPLKTIITSLITQDVLQTFFFFFLQIPRAQPQTISPWPKVSSITVINDKKNSGKNTHSRSWKQQMLVTLAWKLLKWLKTQSALPISSMMCCLKSSFCNCLCCSFKQGSTSPLKTAGSSDKHFHHGHAGLAQMHHRTLQSIILYYMCLFLTVSSLSSDPCPVACWRVPFVIYKLCGSNQRVDLCLRQKSIQLAADGFEILLSVLEQS